MKKYIWVTTALVIGSFSAIAQVLPCGNGHIDTLADAVAQRFAAAKKETGRTVAVDYLVRVYFHVFRNSDGSNAAATPAQIASEFSNLLSVYAPDNICFLNCGVEYLNNTTLNNSFNADNDSDGSAFDGYQVPNCINIFYLQKINGNNTACSPPCGIGGIALGGIPGTFYLMSTGNIGAGGSVAHEMGHCLGLLHTFETAYGYEKINGANGSSSADKVTDTKADPFAYNDQTCFSMSASKCLYTGFCQDPNGQTNFTPPYNNFMSYWSGACYPTPVASTGQFARVESFLGSDADLQNCSSPGAALIINHSQNLGYYMVSGINSLSTAGTVSLSAVVEATLGAGMVVLSPGFTAAPSLGGKVQIVVKPCN